MTEPAHPSPPDSTPAGGAREPSPARSYSLATSAQRDAGMLRLMGWFFLIFGVLVWLGMFWDRGLPARVVSAGAGLVLVALGLAAMAIAARWRKRGSSDAAD